MGDRISPKWVRKDWIKTADRQNKELIQVMDKIVRIGGERPCRGSPAEDRQEETYVREATLILPNKEGDQQMYINKSRALK